MFFVVLIRTVVPAGMVAAEEESAIPQASSDRTRVFIRLSGLIGREHVRLCDGFSNHRIIGNDYGCSWLKFISELVSELGTKMQSRCQGIGVHAPALTRYPHPARLFVRRGEPARLSSGSLQHGENMVAEFVTAH